MFPVMPQNGGEETFGFFRKSDFETSEDGNIVHHPDGSSQNRTGMPNTIAETYTEIPQEKQPLYDQNATLGSNENPLPASGSRIRVPICQHTRYRCCRFGFGKNLLNGIKPIRWNISISSIAISLKRLRHLAFPESFFPTVFPEGFVQAEVRVTKDYRDNTTDFLFLLHKPWKANMFFCG